MPRWPEHDGLTVRRLEGFAHVEGGPLSDAEAATFVVAFDAEPPAPGERAELVFDGVATVWEAALNDELIASGTSMFRGARVDVGALLREDGGGNVLTIRCRALDDVLAEQPKRPRQRWRTRVVDNAGALRFVRTSVLGRAPGFAPGPPAVGPVWLVRRRGVQVDDVVLRPRVVGDDGVLAVSARVAGAASVEVVVGGATAALAAGAGGGWSGEVRVPGAERWWPHTHGAPALYDVVLRVDGVDVGVGATGFRTLGSADAARCVVNGIDVFARGVVWTPAPDGAAARATLELLRDAGINMVRIPGTGVYEDDAFHDACDELGLLVWQDFMFANMDYPIEDPGFRAQVVQEARDVLARIGGRPSLAVLCGGSEIEQQAAMFGVDPALARGELVGELLPALAREAGVDVPYVSGAPSGGALPFHPREGVANWFGVGGYRRPLSDARAAEVRFASECLAFANVPDGVCEHDVGVMRDAGAGWDFADVRDHYLRELWGVGRDHPRYWALARQVTGELMAYVFGEWRRAASPTRGGLILWSRDLRAGSGWGVVDVDGRPKVALRVLARVVQPRAVWIVDEGLNGLDVHVANDRPEPLDAVLDVAILAGGAQVLADASAPVRVAAHAVERRNVEELLGRFVDASYAYRFGPAAHDTVVATLRAADGAVLSQAVWFPTGPPLVPEAFALDAVFHDGAVTITSARVAWGVRIDAPGFDAEDDAFPVVPGIPRTVRLRPAGAETPWRGGRVSALNLIGEPPVGTPDLAP
jgi:beta-mannosidase